MGPGSPRPPGGGGANPQPGERRIDNGGFRPRI
jgi:hypothetical protein